MDQYERGEYAKEIEEDNVEKDAIQVAKDLCKKGNDLKTIKIFEFRKHMQNDFILEYCARAFL